MKKLVVVLVLVSAVYVCAQKGGLKATVKATASGHSVALGWTQSASNGVTGNNVYKATGACPQTFGAALNTSTTPITTYTDTAVSAMQSYCYAVTATCATCSPSESIKSNSVTATIPGDSQPLPPVLNSNPVVQ